MHLKNCSDDSYKLRYFLIYFSESEYTIWISKIATEFLLQIYIKHLWLVKTRFSDVDIYFDSPNINDSLTELAGYGPCNILTYKFQKHNWGVFFLFVFMS